MNKIKAGVRTSEFWASMITAVVIAVSDQLGYKLSAEATAGVVALVVGYAFTRLGVKR